MQEKKCIKCEVTKPLDEFSKHKRRKDGHQPYCKGCRKEYDAQRYQNNSEREKERTRKYSQEHKKERNEWARNRRANDPALNLRRNVSNMINHALYRNGGGKDGESVFQYLPYTMEELKEHLESQFEPGMTWKDRSEWHIDHIYPHSLLPYDSMDHPNFQKAWALDNLQPLWAKENMSKGNKIIGEQ